MTHFLSQKNTPQMLIPRQRYNPTFTHHEIFNNFELDLKRSRCTPTFYSTVLDTQGYNIKTVHKKNQKEIVRPNSAVKGVYSNNTQRKRVEQLNPHNSVFNCSSSQWFDHKKQHMISSLVDCKNHGYSKQRKYLQLTSDPVFTDYNYGPINNKVNQLQQYEKASDQIVKLNQPIKQKPIQNQQAILIKQSSQPSPNLKQDKLQKPQLKGNIKDHNSSVKKDFHKNCIPQTEKQLKLKGKKIAQRPQTARKANVVSQKPTFTVIRKNKIPPLC